MRPPFAVFFRPPPLDFRDPLADPRDADDVRPPLAAFRPPFAVVRPPFAVVRPPFAAVRPPFAALRPPFWPFLEELLAVRDAEALLRAVFLREPLEVFVRPVDGAMSAASMPVSLVSAIASAVSGIRTSSFG